MIWTKRIALALPFAVAGVLNMLVLFADRLPLNGQRIAGLGFLFGTPWAWLLEQGWTGNVYVAILWAPALLYSGCLWIVFRGIQLGQKLALKSQ